MKKVYRKPEIFIEKFSVAETIAASCSIPNHNHWSGCGMDVGTGVNLFYEGANSSCAVKLRAGASLSKFCTNGPVAGSIFNS